MASSSNSQTWDAVSPVYERLLTYCSPLRFPPPWNFLQAPAHCRGPVADPAAALADLRARFDEATLQAAAVLRNSPKEGTWLSPLFVSPTAALVALHDPWSGKLSGLLTARGCLPRNRIPVNAMLMDRWTHQALITWGVLLATPHIGEVALLQALELPATLSLGLHRLSLPALKELNNCFGEYPERRLLAVRPTLALVGWSPMTLDAQPPPSLMPVVSRLNQVRRLLDIPLAGVKTWRLSADALDFLRFRLTLRDLHAVWNLFRDSANNLEDMASLLPPGAAPSDAEIARAYAAAQTDLLTQLGNQSPSGALSDRARQARDVYEQMIQQRLIEPLQAWALASGDAVVRNVGMELSKVCHLLHRLSPLMFTRQARQFESALAGKSEPLPETALTQYLALTGRLGNLIRDLCQWQQR